MTKTKWPVKVTAGSVTVKIYKTPGNDGSDRFTVAWYEGETRKRLTCQDADGGAFKQAKREAFDMSHHGGFDAIIGELREDIRGLEQ